MKALVKIAFLVLSLFCVELVSAAEFAVIAHPSVGGQVVSQAKLANLFMIPGASWPDGQPAVPVDLKLPAMIKTDFYQQISGRSQNQLRAYWARQIFTGTGGPPPEYSSASEVLRKVSSTPGAVGYVPREAIEGAAVKVLTVLSDQGR